MARIDLTNYNWGEGYPPVTPEDNNFPMAVSLKLQFNFTATADTNASGDEVQFSVMDTVQEQSPVQMEMLAVTVQETMTLEAEDEYQQFTGRVAMEISHAVQDGETADQARKIIETQISSAEYKDESGLCRFISLYTDDQSYAM